MPYSVKGKDIYKGGKKIATASSHENAIKSMHVRQAVEHNPNWKPTHTKKSK